MRARIVLTRPGGCVSIVCPSENAIRFMGCGGRWPDKPRGWLDEQIDRHIAAGHCRIATPRYVRAMAFGGLNSQEALALIRDRDCAHRGSGIELWDVGQIPSDRWFRDAWRRSHNGGPISIDIKAAKPIQFQKIRHAVDAENKRRAQDLERFDQPVEPNFQKLKSAILAAKDDIELRHVWPKELMQ